MSKILKLKGMRKSWSKLAGTLAILAMLAGGFTGLQADEACRAACNKFADCAIQMHGDAARNQRATLYGGCMNTCEKHRDRVLMCYQQSQNSCSVYQACIMQQGN